MSFTAKFGAFGALIAALVMGLAACQTQGTATKIATTKGDVGPASWLAKPEGDGPFPAVVLAHGCNGTERNTPHQTVWRGLGRHAALLNRNGYVTLIVDSFGPRRITDGCQRPLGYYGVQVSDAHAAFDHLASLPFVDGERIGFVGQSLGGGTALRLANRHSVNGRSERGRATYAALVAYYPYCHNRWSVSLERPILILIGAEDDWTPAFLCTMHAKTGIVEVNVYPGAHHSFDLPIQGKFQFMGHTVAGNPAARQDSQERMLKFFQKHLGGSYEEARGGESDIVAVVRHAD